MNFDFVLLGFKNFKKNAKEIFDLRDFIAIICLFFSFGLMLSKKSSAFYKRMKEIFMLFSLLAAAPAIIKTVIAILAGISESKHKYLEN